MPALRPLLLLVCSVVLVDTTFYAAITPLLPSYVDEFGLSKTEAGILVGAFPLGTLIGSLPGGWLAARLGVKPTVLIGLAGLAASSLAFAFAPGVEVLIAARFVQGFTSAASWAGALAWLVGASPRERRGELIGTALGAAIVGGLLGPVLGGIADVTTPEAAFSGVAVLAALLALWAWRTAAARPEALSRMSDVPRALRDDRVALGMWLIAMPGLMFGAFGVLISLRLDALGAAATGVAAVFLVSAGLEAAVSPFVGRLSDRHGRIAPVLVALTGSAVLLLLLPVPDDLAVLVALALITAPVIGILWAPASALLSDGAEGVGLDQGYAFALLNLGWAIGQTAGSAGGGALADATSDAVPFALLSLTCLATLAVLLRARQRRPAVV